MWKFQNKNSGDIHTKYLKYHPYIYIQWTKPFQKNSFHPSIPLSIKRISWWNENSTSFQLGPIASGAGPHKSKRHVRVACTAVWLRRRLRHVLSWQSVQLATNAFPRGQTDQAGQLRSPLRTRLLPLSLSPFRPLLHPSPVRAAYRALPLRSLSPPLLLPFRACSFSPPRFIPFHVVSWRLLTLVQQRFYAAHLPCNSNGSTG